MILEIKYIGPHSVVTVPGFAHRTAKRGEVVKARVSEGRPLGGCWEIVKGEKEYEAGMKAAQKSADDAKKTAEGKAKAAAEAEMKRLDDIVEKSEPKPAKKGEKS